MQRLQWMQSLKYSVQDWVKKPTYANEDKEMVIKDNE